MLGIRSTAPPCRAPETVATSRTSSPTSTRPAATPAISRAAGPASAQAIRAPSASSTRPAGLRLYRTERHLRLHRDRVPGQHRCGGRWRAGRRRIRPTALVAMPPVTPILVWPIHDYGAAEWNTSTSSPDARLHARNCSPTSSRSAYQRRRRVRDRGGPRRPASRLRAVRLSPPRSAATSSPPRSRSAHAGDFALDVAGTRAPRSSRTSATGTPMTATACSCRRPAATSRSHLGAAADDVTHITALPMRGDLLSRSPATASTSASRSSARATSSSTSARHGSAPPSSPGATIASLAGDQLDLALTGLGQHDVSRRSAPCRQLSTSLAFSADTGSSATDFITNVAAQTIFGTLSAALGAGDVVKVSLDNGATWLTATAAAGPPLLARRGHSDRQQHADRTGRERRRRVQSATDAGLCARSGRAGSSGRPGSARGVGQRCVQRGQHHQRHQSDLHGHRRGRQHDHPVRRHDTDRHRHRHGTGLGPSPPRDTDERHPQHHRQGDGCGRQRQRSHRRPWRSRIDTIAPAVPSAPDLLAASDTGVSDHGQHHQRHQADLHRHGRGGQHSDLVRRPDAVGTAVATRPATGPSPPRPWRAESTASPPRRPIRLAISAPRRALSVTVDIAAPGTPAFTA